MDELEKLAKRAEFQEQQNRQPEEWEEVQDKKSSPGPEVVQALPSDQAAANRAEAILTIAEKAAQMFFDPRLVLGEGEIEAGRDSLAPVIQKYNLAGEGTGRLPYQEEITAGLYLGGLFKRFRRAIAALRASDKAEAEAKAKEQANQKSSGQFNSSVNQANDNGEERKHQSEKQSHFVPSALGLGEVSDPDAPKWLG